MNDRLLLAYKEIERVRTKFYDAEQEAREMLKRILEPAGEHGVSVCPLDYFDTIFVPMAECEPQAFFPITLIRYWNERLEVFVSNYTETEDKARIVLPDGTWEDYVDAHVDTWLMLDCVDANIEWADGYED